MPWKQSTFMSGHSVPTFHMIGSPNAKHSPPLRWPSTISRLPTSLPAAANCSCSSSALFLLVRVSIWCKASCSFSTSSLSLSILHLSQIHFPLFATWALTLPQLLWNQRSHVSHWVPHFRILSHPLHNTRMIFSASTPGPGFSSTPPITYSTTRVVPHRISVPKRSIACPFPFAVRLEVLEKHEILAAQVPTHAQ